MPASAKDFVNLEWRFGFNFATELMAPSVSTTSLAKL